MSHTVSIDDQMAWVLTDQATGRSRTFQSLQAAEMHLDWQENALSSKPAPVCKGWKSLFLRPLIALGIATG